MNYYMKERGILFEPTRVATIYRDDANDTVVYTATLNNKTKEISNVQENFKDLKEKETVYQLFNISRINT